MPHCSAAVLHFRIIPAGLNAPLEFLTGLTKYFTNSCKTFYKELSMEFGEISEKVLKSLITPIKDRLHIRNTLKNHGNLRNHLLKSV